MHENGFWLVDRSDGFVSQEKGRLVAEEKLSLEETIEVKGEDKERSGEETMSKAMDAEQKIAVDKQLEVNS